VGVGKKGWALPPKLKHYLHRDPIIGSFSFFQDFVQFFSRAVRSPLDPGQEMEDYGGAIVYGGVLVSTM